MKLPHRIDTGGVLWSFTWDGWGRSAAPDLSGNRFDESDVVFVRFESSDGRVGTIAVPRQELKSIADTALLERVREASRRSSSPDPGAR